MLPVLHTRGQGLEGGKAEAGKRGRTGRPRRGSAQAASAMRTRPSRVRVALTGGSLALGSTRALPGKLWRGCCRGQARSDE